MGIASKSLLWQRIKAFFRKLFDEAENPSYIFAVTVAKLSLFLSSFFFEEEYFEDQKRKLRAMYMTESTQVKPFFFIFLHGL